ncbi:MAG TPA: signal peptide peptidase SppA [Syntrophobacter fumaroxidans]|nr:signal peptide peptidase SppA [Syntrophobacter fumaroxidans]
MKRRTLWFIVISFFVFCGFIVWLLGSDSDFFKGSNRIGVVEIKGTISNASEILKSIKEFRKDQSIRAILVRIDSPGGGVGPSQEIYRELKRTIKHKPVVASLGGIAASGGYYIASAANRIVASPGTITGSIGVIMYLPMLRDLFGKIGYEMVTIKAGRYKDIGNPGREMTPEEKEIMQASMDEAHRQFIRDVAAGRKMPEEKIRGIADGRIILGQTAKEIGLVDELGNFEDAVDAAVALGHIKGEADIVYAKKKRMSLLDLLLGSDASEKLSTLLEEPGASLRYQAPFAQ